MQYKALYRKYRPDLFSEVIGQDSIVKTLQNSILEDKVSHAYLFCGPRGSGKTSVAKILSKTVNCKNKVNGESCGKCEICTQISNGFLNDIIEIDAASNNGVDEIRELRSKVNLLPSVCKYKIYIIDEVHMLSISAFNALLKTLEEPPTHVIFILATTEPHKLPATIISRCQRFDFKKITEKDITFKIKEISKKEKIHINDAAVDLIAKISDGGLRDAIGILDQVTLYNKEKIDENDINEIAGLLKTSDIESLANNILKGNVENVLEEINNFDKNGKNIKKIIEELMIFLKDNMICTMAPKYYNSSKDIKYSNLTFIDRNETNKIYELLTVLNDLNNKLTNSIYQKLLFEVEIINFISTNCEKNNENANDEEKEVKIEEKKEVKSLDKTKSIKKDKKVIVVDTSKIEELYELRINNAFADASKKDLQELKNKWSLLSKYSIDERYGLVTNLLLDCKILVSSDEYLILTFPYQTIVDRASKNLLEIESLLEKVFLKKYKPAIITDKNWEDRKSEFIKNTKSGNKYVKDLKIIEYKLEKEINANTKEKDDLEFLGDLIEIE